MRLKTGLATRQDDDRTLINDLMDIMNTQQADFTLTFHHLSRLAGKPADRDRDTQALFREPGAIGNWTQRWRARLRAENSDDAGRQASMQAANPVYIPRNHRIEAAIRAAEDHGDFSVFHRLHEVLQRPYERQPGTADYMLPPEPDEVVHQTFCGT